MQTSAFTKFFNYLFSKDKPIYYQLVPDTFGCGINGDTSDVFIQEIIK